MGGLIPVQVGPLPLSAARVIVGSEAVVVVVAGRLVVVACREVVECGTVEEDVVAIGTKSSSPLRPV
jgi:hypothetical protein